MLQFVRATAMQQNGQCLRGALVSAVQPGWPRCLALSSQVVKRGCRLHAAAGQSRDGTAPGAVPYAVPAAAAAAQAD